MRLNNLITFFLDLIFPKKHAVIELERMAALEALKKIPLCTDKSGLIPEMKDTVVIFKYKDYTTKQMVWELKYRGNKKIAKLCGNILWKFISENISEGVLIPVPLARERRRERGFNQNELVIKEIISCDTKNVFSFSFNVLKKIKHTPPQSSIKNRSKRLKNLNGCFTITQSNLIYNKNIILIDDVVTTGSTLAEARSVLLSAGAKNVQTIAIAH
jgi:ComF family protein